MIEPRDTDFHSGCIDQEQGLLLAAYELGLLPAAQQTQFEDHLTRCQACREDFYAMSPLLAAVHAEPGRLRAALDTTDAAAAPQAWAAVAADPARVVPIRHSWRALLQRRLWIPVGAAAAAALALVLLWPSSQAANLRRLAHLEPVRYVQIDARSGSQSEAARLFDLGMDHYTRGLYAEAAGELAAALQEGAAIPEWPALDQARFFLGLSQLLAGRPREALAPLQAASTSALRPLAERSQWYLAQAYLLLGDSQAAQARLQSLADSSVGYRDQATRQIQELQGILGRSSR
jgi:hypothetical protein